MWKRGEMASQEQFLLFSTLLYIYISNFRSQITYSFVKCVCSIYCFPHSLNSDMSRISRSVSVSPLEFEITGVDCTLYKTTLLRSPLPFSQTYKQTESDVTSNCARYGAKCFLASAAPHEKDI